MKPILAVSQSYEERGSEFKGYFNEPFGGVTRFKEMLNMTGQDAPILRTRDPRRRVRSIPNCNGIFARGTKLGWVSGGDLYFDGELVTESSESEEENTELNAENTESNAENTNESTGETGESSEDTEEESGETEETGETEDESGDDDQEEAEAEHLLEDSPKTFVNIGAWVVIFPDKVMYNTETGEVIRMEYSWEAGAEDTVTYESCDMDGNAMGHGSAIYVKITASGIADGVRVNDIVNLSGSEVHGIGGEYQVITLPEGGGIVINGMLEADSETQTGGLKAERPVPDMDYVTECDNRLWGCSSANHEVYACKLGDPTNWHSFQGLSTDSYAVTIGSEGDFTGAVTHLGYVIFMKNNMIHKLFGNKPSNYQLTNSGVRGVMAGSSGSVCIMNETLYYLSQTGMCASEGALPTEISDAWGNIFYHDAVSGSGFGRMWVSMLDPAGHPVLMVYDAARRLWHKEDDLRVKAFAKAETALYAVDDQDVLWLMTGADEGDYDDAEAAEESNIPYMIETGDLTLGTLEKIRVQKILVRLTLTNGSSCRVWVQYDGREWESVAAWQGAKLKYSRSAQIVPRRCDHFRIRIEGRGRMELINLNYVFLPSTHIWVK